MALQGLTRLVIAGRTAGQVRLFVDLGDPMFQAARASWLCGAWHRKPFRAS